MRKGELIPALPDLYADGPMTTELSDANLILGVEAYVRCKDARIAEAEYSSRPPISETTTGVARVLILTGMVMKSCLDPFAYQSYKNISGSRRR